MEIRKKGNFLQECYKKEQIAWREGNKLYMKR